MSLENEMLLEKGKNWAKLVARRTNKLCELRKDEVDLPLQILSGKLFNEAVDQIALEIKCGLYDEMLIPIKENIQ